MLEYSLYFYSAIVQNPIYVIFLIYQINHFLASFIFKFFSLFLFALYYSLQFGIFSDCVAVCSHLSDVFFSVAYSRYPYYMPCTDEFLNSDHQTYLLIHCFPHFPCFQAEELMYNMFSFSFYPRIFMQHTVGQYQCYQILLKPIVSHRTNYFYKQQNEIVLKTTDHLQENID